MNKILVILPNNLGDVIMATPVLEGLKAKYPGCSIHFFVENGFEAGIEGSPFCDEIIKFSRKEIRNALAAPQWKSAPGVLRSFIERIARERYDSIFNLCQHEYISYLIPLMEGKTIAGRRFLREGNHAISDPWSQYLYAIPFSRLSNGLHAADVYRRIAGVKDHGGGYPLEISSKEKAWAKEFLETYGVDFRQRIMIFQPGAAYPSKCWSVEHFITLGRLLVAQGWQIIITGALSEKNRATSISKGIGDNCYTVVGETQFRQSMSLCSCAHGCVSGDTAQMHAAAGLKVPVYALFGPTNPVETGPYGRGSWVFSADCPEKPCFKTKCATNMCLRSILPETVLSCIENGNPGKNPRCDVYRTETESSGDFKLVAISEKAHSYFSEINAFITRKAFEPESDEPVFKGDGKDNALEESGQWLEVVEKMRNLLERYLETHENVLIGEFEREKQKLALFRGIGEFWTALLNIRLNGVPLLNPLEGIRKSLEACISTIRQIRNAMG